MNMFWNEEDEKEQEFQVPESVVDVSYSLSCKCIPNEHAYLLAEALYKALPWLADEELAGIHPVYGAESGNGWERPDTELLFLSRRQKLTLRLPAGRLDEASQLVGQTLDVGGYELSVGKFTTRPLSVLPTLFARNIVARENQSENEFLLDVAEQLKQMDIKVNKMLCGKPGRVELPDQTLFTRSLMLADLEKTESIRLQELGLGPARHYGCGLFLPQKGITAVQPD